MSRLAFILSVLLTAIPIAAEEVQPIALPAPQTSGGMPLMDALKARQSRRAFAPDALPPQMLSNLLWAAWGINRPDSGHRTAPSAHNKQDTDVYVVLAAGAYRYEAGSHELVPIVAGDVRPLAGRQEFVHMAPVNLVYVSRTKSDNKDDQLLYGGAHVGFIAQNVYLFCASEGLATVVRGYVDGAELAKALKLPEGQRVVLAQTVGYPKR